jgi:hypothetical protein
MKTTRKKFLAICKEHNVTAEISTDCVTILAPKGFRFLGTGSTWIDSKVIKPYPISDCYDELIDEIDLEPTN